MLTVALEEYLDKNSKTKLLFALSNDGVDRNLILNINTREFEAECF